MNCAWSELLGVLPLNLRSRVNELGKNDLQQLRLRLGEGPELLTNRGTIHPDGKVTREDIAYVVNAASRYSPWAAATMAQGYLTAPGGHRIGVCGEAVIRDGEVTALRAVTSLCIRVARDFPGIGGCVQSASGSVLILGAPGWGKTTLLRDMVRNLSRREAVSVVDERGELFPPGLDRGRADVLTGASKAAGISMVLRSMGPSWIAVDEITTAEDSGAILQAANCGVKLIATAHAGSLAEFRRRTVYRPLVENHLFETVYVLHRDKSFGTERMLP